MVVTALVVPAMVVPAMVVPAMVVPAMVVTALAIMAKSEQLPVHFPVQLQHEIVFNSVIVS